MPVRQIKKNKNKKHDCIRNIQEEIGNIECGVKDYIGVGCIL